MYAWSVGKKIILSPMIKIWGEQLLFDLYYDIAYKYIYYFKKMRQIQTIKNPITGTEVHQYTVHEYNTRSKSPQYLSSWNHKLPSYTRNIPRGWTITTITRTYKINHDITSSQITTGMRLYGMCTRKQYILIYIPVPMTCVCIWDYLRRHWYT